MSFSPILGSLPPCAYTSIREELSMAHVPARRGKWTRLFMASGGHLGILMAQTPPTIHQKSLGESVSQPTCVPFIAHCSARTSQEKLNSNHLSLGGGTFLPPHLVVKSLKTESLGNASLY